MWIFSQTGFISVVKSVQDPESEALIVRARDRESLTSLAEHAGARIERTLTRDYPYRLTVSRGHLGTWLDQAVEDIDYLSFKERVFERLGSWVENVYAAIHGITGDLTPFETYFDQKRVRSEGFARRITEDGFEVVEP